jgi:flavin reductase (DIM6/NTAB) family NADH-FMN oxidoreductase RutF
MKKSLGAGTIAAPVPAWVIGSYNTEGKPNVMTAAWTGICCSRPPCIGVSLRKATYTYGNIAAWQAFTVNIPSEDFVKTTDYFGIVSGRDTDKFAVSGLTPVKSELVDAPYIKEFPMVIECKVIQTIEIGLHTQFIGEIVDVKADESIVTEDGKLDPEKLKPVIFTPGIRTYHGLGELIGHGFSIGKEIK